MYLTSTSKRVAVVGGVALLAVVGVIALTHKNEGPAVPDTAYRNAALQGNPEPVSRVDPNMPVVYAASPFVSSQPAPVAPAQQMAPMETSDRMMSSTATIEPVALRRRTYYRRGYYRSGRRHVIVKRRPFSHSAAIVGGSAAGGAIVGGLAGGGKGAGIGALAGGAGGLVYDRLTHKKRIVVRR